MMMTRSIVMIAFAFLPAAAALGGDPVALVYRAAGTCMKDQCPEAAAAIARMAGLQVRYVEPKDLDGEDPAAVFRDAVAWLQPGGHAIRAARVLGVRRLRLIREFVRRGGGYVGFCAGAFLADRTVDDNDRVPGLGVIPVETAYYPVDSGKNGILLPVNWRGRQRTLYFNGGGTFKITKKARDFVHVLATYPDGDPATIENRFGRGRVVVTGMHPEAPDDWKRDTGQEDPDGPDLDLALEMLCRAVPGLGCGRGY